MYKVETNQNAFKISFNHVVIYSGSNWHMADKIGFRRHCTAVMTQHSKGTLPVFEVYNEQTIQGCENWQLLHAIRSR